jgi:hypothetical protein
VAQADKKAAASVIKRVRNLGIVGVTRALGVGGQGEEEALGYK